MKLTIVLLFYSYQYFESMTLDFNNNITKNEDLRFQ